MEAVFVEVDGIGDHEDEEAYASDKTSLWLMGRLEE